MQSTIYQVINLVNNKQYIGQTTLTPDQRFARHIVDANKGSNFHFHMAIRKYGEENFTIKEIETIEGDQETVDIAEIYWINKHNTYHNGYNSTLGGKGFCIYDSEVIKIALEAGEKVKEITKKLGCCEETVRKIARKNGITVDRVYKEEVQQYDKDNNYIQSFESQAAAARYLVEQGEAKGQASSATSKINEVVRGKRSTAYGYKWKKK